MRVLLQTVTHLVPGDVYGDRITFIQNTLCRHFFKRDFDHAQKCLFPFHDDFGLNNVKCFVLLDHHGHDHTTQEENPAVFVWMKWTGQSLVQINKGLLSKYNKELSKWPFTWGGRNFRRIPQPPRGSDGKLDPKPHTSLRLGIPLSDDNIVFLREHPERAKWRKTHLHHDLWAKIELFCHPVASTTEA
ncbi:unnamed protein product [Clonostachys rosea f. rosea IK726]|uniref:Uncharacterized protein n=4 Tax=Bionectria ochroleuca TaxID=29856 RepID=A0A0B7K6P9_BIOOC|nr:unnamed protein product [Clonostachys rosea f. rosea IK726]CAG9948752.1 unnamed protein product [Clonostachys rosea f. rosea IK726]CAG9953487.1 unnamed protein product [Clonostachys rosea f. rosea IK726]